MLGCVEEGAGRQMLMLRIGRVIDNGNPKAVKNRIGSTVFMGGV